MFELIEAVMGRLIGSKTWNRIVRIFGSSFRQSVIVHGLFGLFMLEIMHQIVFW